MSFRSNIIAGWVLAACFAALGLYLIVGGQFRGERPEKMGYPIEGVVEASAEGAGAAVPDVPIATLLATADVAKGADAFKKCASCHNANQGGANGIGPNLWAIVGAGIAAKSGFAYSDVLKGLASGKWTFEEMDKWLKNPRSYAAGTKMSFAGLAKGEDRANVIAYLNAQGSNLPLPAAPAAEAPAAEAGAEAADGNAVAPVAADGNATAPAPGK